MEAGTIRQARQLNMAAPMITRLADKSISLGFVVPPLGRKRPMLRNRSAASACGLKAGLQTEFQQEEIMTRNQQIGAWLALTLLLALALYRWFNLP